MATAADDVTAVVPRTLDVTTDKADGGFGGSCDFAPYSMYCTNMLNIFTSYLTYTSLQQSNPPTPTIAIWIQL